MWSLLGLALALFVCIAAWRRSIGAGGFYDTQVYGMTSKAHRRYALGSLAFAVYFAVTFGLGADTAGIAGLMLYALIAAFYGTSFLRGATEFDD
jgi:hypothetical protein